MSNYEFPDCEVQSVTTIIGAQSDKSGLLRWYARMPLEWIREHCQTDFNWGSEETFWEVYLDDFESAIEHPSNEGKRAMGIGTNVHTFIERFLNARK